MLMKGKSTLLLLAAGILSLAGCQKTGLTDGISNGNGNIRFTATASSVGTKTAYGDYDNETDPAWQVVNWVQGDKLRIYSDKAVHRYADVKYADYEIVGEPTVSGHESKATIEGTSLDNETVTGALPNGEDMRNGLIWGDEAATYNFYGIYPSTDCASGSAGTLNGSISADQGTGDLAVNMPKYGFLTAAQQITLKATDFDDNKVVTPLKDGGPNVEMRFEPAFTAIEVTLKSTQPNTVLTGAHLVSSSTALAGDFTVAYTASGSSISKAIDCKSATEKTVSITGLTDATLGPDAPYTFTLFALPQQLKDLELVFDIDGAQSRHLALKKNDKYLEFAACKKHRIYGLQMPDGTWTLYLQEEVAEWEDNAKNPKYGEADDEGAIVSAGALEFVSGNADGSSRTVATLASATEPLVAYYSVYSPTNGKWRITMKGEKASSFTLASPNVEGSSASADGEYIEGPIDQRVFFQVTPASGAASGDSVELWFTVIVGEKEYSLHSEVTRSQLPLTVKMP